MKDKVYIIQYDLPGGGRYQAVIRPAIAVGELLMVVPLGAAPYTFTVDLHQLRTCRQAGEALALLAVEDKRTKERLRRRKAELDRELQSLQR